MRGLSLKRGLVNVLIEKVSNESSTSIKDDEDKASNVFFLSLSDGVLCEVAEEEIAALVF